jgi:hypothetical protein
MTAVREIVLPLTGHPHGWLLLPVAVYSAVTGTPWELRLVLNTGRTQSVLSRSMLAAMRALGLFGAQSGPLFVLRQATVDGALLPDLPLRESAGPGLLGVDGMLGLDFFGCFADACISTGALRLTLRASV